MCLLWFCLFECIVIGWIYGAERFADDIHEMIGFKINPCFVYCWKYFSPLLTFAILSFSFITNKPIKYNNEYEYPWWAILFGWSLALSSMVAVPVYCVYIWFVTEADSWSEKWKILTTSSPSPYLVANLDKNKSETNGNIAHNHV